jgi:hypothetical protein
VVSLLVAGVAADAAGGGRGAPGGMGLSPSRAAEVRLHVEALRGTACCWLQYCLNLGSQNPNP